MIKVFKEIIRNKLTPDEFYILYCMVEGEELGVYNIEKELLSLKNQGYLDEHGVYTEKAVKLIRQIEQTGKKKYVLTDTDMTNIDTYREMFPKGNLPSGQPARVNVKELQKRFAWFFNNYEYTWETILAATKMYVDKYKLADYAYMKTSGYFIYKQEKNEAATSQLANFCDMILEGEDSSGLPSYSSHTVL